MTKNKRMIFGARVYPAIWIYGATQHSTFHTPISYLLLRHQHKYIVIQFHRSLAFSTSTMRPFRIRTITSFINIDPSDFDDGAKYLNEKIKRCSNLLRDGESQMIAAGYEVQTVRIATNSFGQWLISSSTTEEDDDVVVL